MYDRLFSVESPDSEEGDFKDYLNPESIQVIKEAYIEPYLSNATTGRGYQFIRKGYFSLDRESKPGQLIFNRTVSLKEAWKPKS
ncbi:Glutamine--tRNA ligase [compost metagenome]